MSELATSPVEPQDEGVAKSALTTARYVILVADDEGWSVQDEINDYTEAVISVRMFQDVGHQARLVDTEAEFVED